MALALLACSAGAHSPNTCFVRIAVEGAEASVVLSLNWSELAFFPALDENHDRLLQQAEVNRHGEELGKRLGAALDLVDAAAQPLPTRLISATAVPGMGHLEMRWRYTLPADRRGLRVRSGLHEIMTSSTVALVKITAGPSVREAVLDQGHPEAAFDAPGLAGQAVAFLWLGIRHIFTGYDHVLFLVGLLLVGGALLDLVKIVSSFTVAHSITLALASVALPPRFVESAIALSICYVAAENIFFPDVARRWIITFFFGLVHGFGFATVLRELELPRPSLATSLVFFNLWGWKSARWPSFCCCSRCWPSSRVPAIGGGSWPCCRGSSCCSEASGSSSAPFGCRARLQAGPSLECSRGGGTARHII